MPKTPGSSEDGPSKGGHLVPSVGPMIMKLASLFEPQPQEDNKALVKKSSQKTEFEHTKKLGIIITNQIYEPINEPDLPNVEANLNVVHSKLKTVLNFQDEEIYILRDMKRNDLEK